jgi:hypothetical protein
MTSIYQAIAIAAAGTVLSFTVLEVNPAQAKNKIIENDSYQLPQQTAAVIRDGFLSKNTGNLQQGRKADLILRENSLIAQASPYNFSTYWLTTTTNNQGFFSVAHGLSANRIWGIQVAVQHANGNWHTLEFSHTVDNRFWWNNQYVSGWIASPNFYNRPVRILLKVS